MSHKARVERHIMVDILAGILGAALVAALIGKSWLAATLALASGVVLFFMERSNIKEEDTLEESLHPVLPPKNPLALSVKDIAVLGKSANRSHTQNVPQEGLAYYMAGLEDGASVQAEWVLDQLEAV